MVGLENARFDERISLTYLGPVVTDNDHRNSDPVTPLLFRVWPSIQRKFCHEPVLARRDRMIDSGVRSLGNYAAGVPTLLGSFASRSPVILGLCSRLQCYLTVIGGPPRAWKYCTSAFRPGRLVLAQ